MSLELSRSAELEVLPMPERGVLLRVEGWRTRGELLSEERSELVHREVANQLFSCHRLYRFGSLKLVPALLDGRAELFADGYLDLASCFRTGRNAP